MATHIGKEPVGTKASSSSHVVTFLRRAPLVMMVVIFTLVSFRYLAHPVRTAAEAGITFTSAGGITIARVGFAGFPLAFAILAVAALISSRRRLAGLYMVLTVVSVVIAVRIFGILMDHSAASAPLFVPEAVLLALSIVAIRLESARTHGEAGIEPATDNPVSR